jgi:ubiquinone/menaquinone biosynthesis C-methylase UbiE
MAPKSVVPPDANPAARFWDRTARKYARTPVRNEAVYQTKLEHIRSLLHPEMDILEFGCGTGTTALALAKHVRTIHASDISAGMIKIAKEKAMAAAIANVQFEVMSFEDCPETASRFDLIMGHSILHLMEDYAAAIRKVHVLLKPGGRFISSTMCLDDDLKFLRLITPLGRFLGFMPPVAFFSQQQLVASLERADFTIEYQWKPARRNAVFIVAAKPA